MTYIYREDNADLLCIEDWQLHSANSHTKVMINCNLSDARLLCYFSSQGLLWSFTIDNPTTRQVPIGVRAIRASNVLC